ncbi:MAG TPA: DUF5615 family PIN-like protein [Kiritimatiellia bacterium]|nr:DUF5615 family PIN-like protein [Kiritimatiellia bacterium]HMO97576.1 DUF5615 family PIN-like protein [Kiritimatiellia bacterium]HMP96773.1 DUF5615 family PIN-like protein [Kiritimatiellia bacterium]
MDFKLDENLPAEACQLLRNAGHDALSVLDQHLGGAPDSHVAAVCLAESRTFITLDTDFANAEEGQTRCGAKFQPLENAREKSSNAWKSDDDDSLSLLFFTYNAPGGYHDDCVIALALANSERFQFKWTEVARIFGARRVAAGLRLRQRAFLH